MRHIIDKTRSKNPIPVPDQADVRSLESEIADIGYQISKLKDFHDILATDDKQQACVDHSKARVLQLVEESLNKPLTNQTMIWHGEMRGRIAERFRITQELQGLVAFADDVLAPKKKGLMKTLANIVSKLSDEEGQ